MILRMMRRRHEAFAERMLTSECPDAWIDRYSWPAICLYPIGLVLLGLYAFTMMGSRFAPISEIQVPMVFLGFVFVVFGLDAYNKGRLVAILKKLRQQQDAAKAAADE